MMRFMKDRKKYLVWFLTVALTLSVVGAEVSFAQNKKNRPQQRSKAVSRPKPQLQRIQPAPSRANTSQSALSEALNLARNQQYDQAAVRLYNLSRRKDLQAERMQIKYILGVSLLEMKYYQVAAFQFVDVIRNGASKYTKQAIEKLVIAADALGDETLLNYAITKVRLDDFPAQYKEMIYYRLGEINLKNRKFEEAAQSFGRVSSNSRYYAQAKFNRALAFLEDKQPVEALKALQALYNSRSNASITDTNRVAATLGIARAYYQAQDWDRALEWYRKVPRDTEMWHDALFESSWAYLRAAKFRSALSNFQSLHSAYYEDFYIPEALLLRSIVYLYICKYDEMEKVLDLFEKTYGPVRSTLGTFIQNNRDPMAYYSEIEKALARSSKASSGAKVPYSVAKYIFNQGDVRRASGYLKMINEEKSRLERNQVIANSALSSYAHKILSGRIKNTRVSIGDMVKAHMVSIRGELRDLYEQAGFARYEMINGRKETLRKKIAGKDIKPVDEDLDRDFYVQNGYEYWPFDGEYWLDEVGNYHYLGKQSCE